jgi:hypothetical protein
MLKSKKDGTSNLINHLYKQHHITKHSTRKATQSVVDLLNNSANPKTSVQLPSPKDSIINWIVDSFTPFSSIERPSFQRMFEAHSTKCAIRNADTIHNRVIERYTTSVAALKAQLEWDCSSIALSFDGWTTRSTNIPISAIIGHWIGID